MSAVTSVSETQHDSPWWEILLVMAASLAISLLVPSLQIVAILIPVAYLIVERHLRKRTWSESGLNIRAFPQDLLHNIGWVLLVGVGTQALSVFGSYWLLPGYSAHVMARLPFDARAFDSKVLNTLLVITLGEEIIYRALFQKRLSAFLPVPAAIALSSIVFAMMHYVPGPAAIVVTDLGLIVVDSVIYGVIFARSNNVWVAWAAHFLADVCGMVFLLALAR
jgi:uncharacterized protein